MSVRNSNEKICTQKSKYTFHSVCARYLPSIHPVSQFPQRTRVKSPRIALAEINRLRQTANWFRHWVVNSLWTKFTIIYNLKVRSINSRRLHSTAAAFWFCSQPISAFMLWLQVIRGAQTFHWKFCRILRRTRLCVNLHFMCVLPCFVVDADCLLDFGTWCEKLASAIWPVCRWK